MKLNWNFLRERGLQNKKTFCGGGGEVRIFSGTAQLILMVFDDELGSPSWAWKCLPQVGQT